MKFRHIASALILILVLSLAGWAGFRLTHPTSVATLQLHCPQFPPDDTALQHWLSSQPTLENTSVTRNNGALIVRYKMQGRDAGDFSSSVIDQCKQLGYQVNGYSVASNSNPFQN